MTCYLCDADAVIGAGVGICGWCAFWCTLAIAVGTAIPICSVILIGEFGL